MLRKDFSGYNDEVKRTNINSATQRQTAVTAYLTSKQLLLFALHARIKGQALYMQKPSQIYALLRLHYVMSLDQIVEMAVMYFVDLGLKAPVSNSNEW